MADIELVIKVPEEAYNFLKSGYFIDDGTRSGKTILQHFCRAIYNGKKLPKEHDIIDGTELNKFLDDLIYAEQKIRLNGYETRTDIIERIKIKADSLTIIEANKGDSED